MIQLPSICGSSCSVPHTTKRHLPSSNRTPTCSVPPAGVNDSRDEPPPVQAAAVNESTNRIATSLRLAPVLPPTFREASARRRRESMVGLLTGNMGSMGYDEKV